MIDIIYDDNAIKLFGVATPGTRVITYNDIPVGIIDYYIKGEKIHICYIKIGNEFRRKGLASKVINKFKENHKGKYITGDSLPGAIKFWESMGAEFYEDPFDDYCTPFIIEF